MNMDMGLTCYLVCVYYLWWDEKNEACLWIDCRDFDCFSCMKARVGIYTMHLFLYWSVLEFSSEDSVAHRAWWSVCSRFLVDITGQHVWDVRIRERYKYSSLICEACFTVNVSISVTQCCEAADFGSSDVLPRFTPCNALLWRLMLSVLMRLTFIIQPYPVQRRRPGWLGWITLL